AGHRRAGLRVGADRLRDGHAARRDRCGARLDVGRCRRLPAVRRRRAPGARPRARHDRARIRRARGPRRRSGLAAARRGAGGGRRALDRRDARGDRGDLGDARRRSVTGPTRAAGWGRGPEDGTILTWTVAEGRKGRRWREVVGRGSDVVHSLLLETDPNGRFSHLELARADGLWTFHPEADGTLHGNHVGGPEPGVRHVAGWAFGPRDVLLVEGSAVSAAAIAWAHRDVLAAG